MLGKQQGEQRCQWQHHNHPAPEKVKPQGGSNPATVCGAKSASKKKAGEAKGQHKHTKARGPEGRAHPSIQPRPHHGKTRGLQRAHTQEPKQHPASNPSKGQRDKSPKATGAGTRKDP